MSKESGLTRGEWLSRRRTVFAIAGAVWMSFAVIHVFQTSVLADATGREWTLWGGIVYAFPWWLSWLVLTPIIAWLAHIYGSSASLVLQNATGGGAEALVTIPAVPNQDDTATGSPLAGDVITVVAPRARAPRLSA